jgi:hypothetical protein
VVVEMALEEVYLRVLRFFPVDIIPPLLHIHAYIIWRMDKGPIGGPVPQVSPRARSTTEDAIISATTVYVMCIKNTFILKGSDDGVMHFEESCFRTSSIVQYFPLKTFQKLALLPSSGKRRGGGDGTYSVESLGKS